MRGERRKRREQLAELQSQMAQALADVTCPRCGRVLEGRSAYTIHADSGCEHPEGFGQLVQLKDGRWGQRWKHPELR